MLLWMLEEMGRRRRFPFNIQNYRAHFYRDPYATEEAQPSVEPEPAEKPQEPEKLETATEEVEEVKVKEVSSSFTQTDKEKEKKKPKVQAKVQPKVQPKVRPKVQPKTKPKSQTKIQPKAVPKTKPKSQTKIKPKSQTKIKPKSQPKIQPKAQPKIQPKPKIKAKSQPKIQPKSQLKIQLKAQPKSQPKVQRKDLVSLKGKKKVQPKPVMSKKKNKKKSIRKVSTKKEPSLPSIASKLGVELARESVEPLRDLDHLPREVEESPQSTPPNTATSCSKSTLIIKKIIKEVGPKVDCWRSLKLHGNESAKRNSRLKLESLLRVIKVLLEEYDLNNTVVKAKGYLLSLKKEIKDCLNNDLIPVEPSVPDLPTFYEPRTNYKEFNPRRKFYGYVRPPMIKKTRGLHDDVCQDRTRTQIRTIPLVDPTSDIVETRLSVRPKLNEAEISGEVWTNKPNENGEDPYDILKSFRIGKSAMEHYIPPEPSDSASGYDTRFFYDTEPENEPKTNDVETIYQNENYLKEKSEEMFIFEKEEDRELDRKLAYFLKDVFTFSPLMAKEVEMMKKNEKLKKEGQEVLNRLEKEVKQEMPSFAEEDIASTSYYKLKESKKNVKKPPKNPLISSVKLAEIVYDKSSKGAEQKFVNKNSAVKPGIIYKDCSQESLFDGDDCRLFFPPLVEESFANDQESAEKAKDVDIRSLKPDHSFQLKLLVKLFQEKQIRDEMVLMIEKIASKKMYHKFKFNMHRLDEIIERLSINLFEKLFQSESSKDQDQSGSVERIIKQAHAAAARKKFQNDIAEIIFTIDRIKKLLRNIGTENGTVKNKRLFKNLFSRPRTLKNLLQSNAQKNIKHELNTNNKCKRIRSLSELIAILKEKNKQSMKRKYNNQAKKLAFIRSKVFSKENLMDFKAGNFKQKRTLTQKSKKMIPNNSQRLSLLLGNPKNSKEKPKKKVPAKNLKKQPKKKPSIKISKHKCEKVAIPKKRSPKRPIQPKVLPKVPTVPKTINKVTVPKKKPNAVTPKLTINRKLPAVKSRAFLFKPKKSQIKKKIPEVHDCFFQKNDITGKRHLNFDTTATNVLNNSFSHLSLISVLSQMLHMGLDEAEAKEGKRYRDLAKQKVKKNLKREERKKNYSKGSRTSRLFSKLCTAVTLCAEECLDFSKLPKTSARCLKSPTHKLAN